MTDTASLKPITVTVTTALAVTGLGRTKFYELVEEGRIRTVAIGRRTLVIFADLEKLAEPGAARKMISGRRCPRQNRPGRFRRGESGGAHPPA